jgi:endonuclease/exonuclease/phosphatase family metal-dependent hydrolase
VKEFGPFPDFGDAVISFHPIIETTARRIHTQHDPGINCKTKGDAVDELCDGTFAKLTGVTIKAGDRLLRAYTVHLTANPSDPREHERQLGLQVSDVLEVIRKDKARASNVFRAVLTGDFNFEPPANVNNPPVGPYKTLMEKFEDAWVKANACPPGSGRACGATEPAPTTQHPGNRPHRRIDYVLLYRGSGFTLKTIRVLRTEPCKGADGPCLSDHLPVSGTISF